MLITSSPSLQHAVSTSNTLMWDSHFPVKCTPGTKAGDFTCNSPVTSACHISVQSLPKTGDNHTAQTISAAKAKLVSNRASSTNTAKKLIVSVNNFKEDPVSLQVPPIPAQPPCQLHTQQAPTSNGVLLTPLLTGISRQIPTKPTTWSVT